MTHARTFRLALATLFGVVLAAGCSRESPTHPVFPAPPVYDGGVGMIGGGRTSSGIGMIGGGRSDSDSTSTQSSTPTVTPGS
jgi:hypothetical protein